LTRVSPGDATAHVFARIAVQHHVRNLVRDLVRVAFETDSEVNR